MPWEINYFVSTFMMIADMVKEKEELNFKSRESTVMWIRTDDWESVQWDPAADLYVSFCVNNSTEDNWK